MKYLYTYNNAVLDHTMNNEDNMEEKREAFLVLEIQISILNMSQNMGKHLFTKYILYSKYKTKTAGLYRDLNATYIIKNNL